MTLKKRRVSGMLHGKADFTRKAPIISRAIVKDGTLTLSGYFFGTDGELYIDDNPVAAKTWNDQEVTAQVSGLPNGMHTAKIINADAARFTTVFSSSMKTEGRRLYENAYALPLGEEKWIQDKADGIFGMTAADGFLYVMAVYGNEQAQALWRMNLETQAWERCSDLPDVLKGRTMENSGLAAYRGKLYCYTAREGLYSRTPSLCSYDPETDLWEEISLDGLAKSGQIFVLQDTLFLVSDQEKAGSFFRIDPDAGTVDPVSGSLPEISGFYTAVLAPGGDALYLYGSGGYDDNFEEIMKLYRFTWDGQTETFSTQDLSDALAAIGPIDLNQCAMAGLADGAALVSTSDSGQDTFLMKDGSCEFRILDQVSCYKTAFSPVAAASGSQLYVLALNATEPDVAYLRSTAAD